MRTITFASAKGGVGKSTLAIGIAVAAQQDGEQVYLIDADPQRSVFAWGERRKAETPGVDRVQPSQLPDALIALHRSNYTLAIIDTQGADTGGTAAAMRVANLVAVPVRPFAIDVLAVGPTEDAIQRLGKPYCMILNAVQPRVSARLADVAEAFNGKVGPSIVNRFAHADAVGIGLGVTEAEPESLAAMEIRELWAFLKEKLK
jgi:chromosome partitioning protein